MFVRTQILSLLEYDNIEQDIDLNGRCQSGDSKSSISPMLNSAYVVHFLAGVIINQSINQS